MLVISPDAPPRLVMPGFELPRVADLPQLFEPVTWNDGDDPAALLTSLLPNGGAGATVGLGGQMFAQFFLRIRDLAPTANYVDGDRVMVPVRCESLHTKLRRCEPRAAPQTPSPRSCGPRTFRARQSATSSQQSTGSCSRRATTPSAAGSSGLAQTARLRTITSPTVLRPRATESLSTSAASAGATAPTSRGHFTSATRRKSSATSTTSSIRRTSRVSKRAPRHHDSGARPDSALAHRRRGLRRCIPPPAWAWNRPRRPRTAVPRYRRRHPRGRRHDLLGSSPASTSRGSSGSGSNTLSSSHATAPSGSTSRRTTSRSSSGATNASTTRSAHIRGRRIGRADAGHPRHARREAIAGDVLHRRPLGRGPPRSRAPHRSRRPRAR